VAVTLDGQTVTAVETIAPPEALGNVLGIAFYANDPPSPVTIYLSRTELYEGDDGPPYAGKITKLVAPEYEPVDIITGLPVGGQEHGTNGIAFDAEGRLLIGQGAMTNAGVPSERHPRDESPLSAAVLVADVFRPGFDGDVRYDPPDAVSTTVNQVAGDVEAYAAGFRNPYDLVLHSNGNLYVTTNGPNLNAGPASASCTTEGDEPWARDELNLVVEGGYYGHPNRNRGRFDERQCTYHPGEDESGGVNPPLAALALSGAATGIVEYTADALDGQLRGDLIYTEWNLGRVWRVQLSEDGTSVSSISQLIPEELDHPTDVTVGPDGTIYIAEWGSGRIVFLSPDTPSAPR
jgi:glucose/arabinose dehydrogenase